MRRPDRREREKIILALSVPAPVIVLGVIVGMTYGVLGVGLILIYRSNRIINFATGEIGIIGAALLGLAVTRWHVPYWVAFPGGLGVGALVGALCEVTVIRRLRRAPALMSVIATLGLAAFLDAEAQTITSGVTNGRLYPQPPFLPNFSFGSLRINQVYSCMLIVTPLIVLLLAVFLRRDRRGLAIRAAAANTDAARMAGVSANGMSMLAWAIAGALSAYTAILILPTVPTGSGQIVGPTLLFRALAVAVIARMSSISVAMLAGIGIGIVEQVVLWNYPSGGQTDPILLIIVLVALLLQPRQTGRAQERGSWAIVQPWAPLPRSLLQIRSVRLLGWYTALGVALLAVVLVATLTQPAGFTMSVVCAFALVGLSVGVLGGLAGELSLGQFGLAGIGATVSYVVFRHTGDFLIAFLAAGIMTAVVSLVIGLPAVRIRGFMLAAVTLGFGLVCQNWLFSQSWMMGGVGVTAGTPHIGHYLFNDGKRYFAFSCVVLAFGFWIARNIWRSGIGRRMRAVRDNEDNARAYTVRATRVKVVGFMLAGFLAGVGGALFGQSLFTLAPTGFPIDASIDVVAMAVLGGIGVLIGPLLGALYIIAIPRFLPLDNAELAATSLGWLLLILYAPGGIAQLLRPLRDRIVRMLARRHGVSLDETQAARSSTGDLPATAVARLLDAPRRRPEAAIEGQVVLEGDNLSKAFGGVRAVDDVSLRLTAGEILGLIGPNGAGKTTLFELLSGFTPIDKGRVVFEGRDITRLDAAARARLGIARSFQDAGLFPTLTVVEVLMVAQERTSPTPFAASLVGLRGNDKRKEAKADELLELMGLGPFRDYQINALSTGTKRIVEITCLAALEPAILLLDEPSSGIAQRETETLEGVIRALKAYLGASIIVIEHDIPLVSALADRMIAMDAGRVLAVGSPTQVLADPGVVTAYLGTDTRAIERSTFTASAAPTTPTATT
jgi:ABC-type branched-subunit amino acid transport system ATPase component/ABC-type branched-subunit amino acid transport system permease subunit